MNVEAILNDLEKAERALRTANLELGRIKVERRRLIQQALDAGVPQAVIGRLLGVSRQRIHQLT